MKEIPEMNQGLADQIEGLKRILLGSQPLTQILEKIPALNLPNWYLGAGCIAQTIWNYTHGFDLTTGIKDCDLVYYDPDASYEAEDRFIKQGELVFNDSPLRVEIRNQARVHLWYEKHFGYPIEPYKSVETAINTWPTTATSVAVCYEGDKLRVYAPYGLHDLLSLTVRPNKTQITEEIYNRKVDRWVQTWPNLTIIPWRQ